MICAGIDAGSRAVKVVLFDGDTDRVLTTATADQGVDQETLVRDLYADVLAKAGTSADQVHRIVATGYARQQVRFADTTITEITCHAKGVRHVVPETRTVIEIGGQDSKLLRLDGQGKVRDFVMNDRCAAGTGRFLEMVAARFEIALSEVGELAERSSRPAVVSSMCVVFAETEIIGLLAAGTAAKDIAAGVQHSIATRVSAMAGRNVTPPIVFTGGVALIPGMDNALATVLDQPVTVAPDPQMTGALGAALLAAQR